MDYYVVTFKTKYGYENDEVDITPFIIQKSSHDDDDNVMVIINALIHSNDSGIMACIFKLVLDHGRDKHSKRISKLYKILYESKTFITSQTIENDMEQYMKYIRRYKKALLRFLFMMSYISDEYDSKCTYLFIQRRKIIKI